MDLTINKGVGVSRKKRERPSPKVDRTPEQQAIIDRKKAIEDAYVQVLGYTPAAFGREAKAAKWLAEQGYTPEQVVNCYKHLQEDDFYRRQHTSLETVSKQIGAWAQSRQRKTAAQMPEPLVDEEPALTQDELRARALARRNGVDNATSRSPKQR
jgi:hypothetical protein